MGAGLLTENMGEWAHRVRFVSNDPRHADEKKPHVSADEASVVLEYAQALGYFLYVLPSLIRRTKAEDGDDTKAS